MLWPLRPNWRESYRVRFEFKTDIFTSRSGKEQRRAARSSPRESHGFTITVGGDDARRYNALMAAAQRSLVTLPDYSRHVRLKNALSVGGSTVIVNAPAPWLEDGAAVVLASADRAALLMVASVADGIVTFAEPVDADWQAGARLHPALDGHLAESISARGFTSRITEAEIEFAVDPARSDAAFYGDVEDVFQRREVCPFEPNFASPISATHLVTRETVDFGRGRIATFHPANHLGRSRQFQLLLPSSDARDDAVAFFTRMKGQRGEFYASLFEDDFTPVAPAAAGTTTLTLRGEELHEAFQADAVRRAVLIRRGGDRFYRAVTTSSAVAGNTVLTTDLGWPCPIDDQVVMQWLVVHRFATDLLDIEYVSDAVARSQISVTTLDDRPVLDIDAAFAGLDGAAEWALNFFGKKFFETRIADPIDYAVNHAYPFVIGSIGPAAIRGLNIKQLVDHYGDIAT